jgi:hypothetical protein
LNSHYPYLTYLNPPTNWGAHAERKSSQAWRNAATEHRDLFFFSFTGVCSQLVKTLVD